jgi:hypothetical protein
MPELDISGYRTMVHRYIELSTTMPLFRKANLAADREDHPCRFGHARLYQHRIR